MSLLAVGTPWTEDNQEYIFNAGTLDIKVIEQESNKLL